MSDPREAAERAATFKPGDRVRVKHLCGERALSGKLGTVRRPPSGAGWDFWVKLDGLEAERGFMAPEIEPAPSIPAAVQGGGEGLRETAENAAREWWNSAEVYGGTEYRIRSLADLLVSFAALRAAPAPVPEVSDDMVKRALNEIIAQSGNIYFPSKHGVRAALTAALASTSAQDREGGE